MDCGDNVADKRVLVVDDLYMDGETLGEAVRALRSRNASEVFALCAVKTTKGTQGGVDDLLPGAEDSEIPFI
jgi:phosphoribosylpyrophosphate synthetase